jgi:metallophosphoesterase (TIGR00282 family)
VITNAENVADGYGITPEISNILFNAGVNVISTGNHIWDKSEIIPYIAKNCNLLKPNNLTNQSAGQGFILYKTKSNKKILVINLLCNLFMRKSDNLFESVNNIMKNYKLKKNCDAIIVDIHGEAASEKQALANFLDGKVTAIIGTHTHVPTSDLRILPNGTAYQTDAGMCGDYDSVIGGEKNKWIENFIKKPGFEKIKPASTNHTMCGVIIKVFEDTGLSSVAKQLILGDILENKIPNEKLFLK